MVNQEEVRSSGLGGRVHRNGHRRSNSRRIIFFLMMAVAMETLILVFMLVNLSVQAKENTELVVENKKLSMDLAQARPELEKLRAEVDSLVAGRLPHLTRLEFDKVIPVEKNYVKNLLFTLAGTSKEHRYEYKIVMHNSGLLAVHPLVDVLFFDRVGMQIGVSRLGVREDGTLTLDMLERGEIRSFTGTVETVEDEKPEYFLVRVRQ